MLTTLEGDDSSDVDRCDLKPKTISKSDSTRTKIAERARPAGSVRLLVPHEVVRRSSTEFSVSRVHLSAATFRSTDVVDRMGDRDSDCLVVSLIDSSHRGLLRDCSGVSGFLARFQVSERSVTPKRDHRISMEEMDGY